jgi:hypothetical protein
VNAFPWDSPPRFLIRDRDRAYGLAFSARVRGLGIREIRTAVRAPRMNAFAERVIGTLRRECFDYLIVLNERHAQRLLAEFRHWYNQDEQERLRIPPKSGQAPSVAKQVADLHEELARGGGPARAGHPHRR